MSSVQNEQLPWLCASRKLPLPSLLEKCKLIQPNLVSTGKMLQISIKPWEHISFVGMRSPSSAASRSSRISASPRQIKLLSLVAWVASWLRILSTCDWSISDSAILAFTHDACKYAGKAMLWDRLSTIWVLPAMTCNFKHMIKASGKSWKAHMPYTGRWCYNVWSLSSCQERGFHHATVCQPRVAAVTWCDVSLLRIARVFLGRRSNGVYFCATRHGSQTGLRIVKACLTFCRLLPQINIYPDGNWEQTLLHESRAVK